MVKATVAPDEGGPAAPPPDGLPKEYNGKPAWTRAEMARRAPACSKGSYVNLGTGIPTLVSNYIEGRDIVMHGENGILGYGEMVQGDAIDHDIFNASGQYVAINPGASFFDSVDLVRDGARRAHRRGPPGRVSGRPGRQPGQLQHRRPRLGGIGGAMDLVAGKQPLIILMEHRDSKDRPELVAQDDYPLTGVTAWTWSSPTWPSCGDANGSRSGGRLHARRDAGVGRVDA